MELSRPARTPIHDPGAARTTKETTMTLYRSFLLAILTATMLPLHADALVWVMSQGNHSVTLLDDLGWSYGTTSLPAMPGSMAALNGGRKAFVAEAFGFRLWTVDALTSAVTATTSVGYAQHVATSPDESRVYVASNSYGVVVVDAATSNYVGQVFCGFDVKRVLVSPDSTRIYAIGESGVARIDAATRMMTASRLWNRTQLGATAIDRTGARIYVASQFGLESLDTTTLAIRSEALTNGIPSGLAFRNDGAVLFATHSAAGRLTSAESVALITLRSGTLGGAPGPIVETKHGGSGAPYLAVGKTATGEVAFVNQNTLATVATVPVGGQPTSIAATWEPTYFNQSTPSLDLTYQTLAAGSTAQSVTFSNTSGRPVPLAPVTVLGSPSFLVTANSCTGTLAAGGTCTVSVRCQPTAPPGTYMSTKQTFSGSLRVSTSPALQVRSVGLKCRSSVPSFPGTAFSAN